MEIIDKVKPANAGPKLSALEHEKIRFAELTAEVKAVHVELIGANQAIRDFKNLHLHDLEAHRDAVGRKQDRILKEYSDAQENLEKKGVSCG